MSGFIDKMRSEPPSDRQRISVFAADPDIHVLGLASVVALIHGGMPITIEQVSLMVVEQPSTPRGKMPKRVKQQAITEGMCRLLGHRHFDKLCTRPQTCGVFETQVFYPDLDMERPEMVEKANSLIACATVTGRLVGLAFERQMPVRTVAPSIWKGNRKKAADHHRSAMIVGAAPVTVCQADALTHPPISTALMSLPAKYEHAMDALGMSLYGIEQLHRGLWT